jgi:uncharacterized protein YndB with AHSA1/START domain
MKTIFTRDLPHKQLNVVREFAAPVDEVWKAWTDPALLDQWWAPLPFKTVTQSMTLRPGGQWLYYMEGPEGERHYCCINYREIRPGKMFSGVDAFCDEKGNLNTEFPRMDWEVQFFAAGAKTRVEVLIRFASEADLLKITEMGFQQGFSMAHENLDRLLGGR